MGVKRLERGLGDLLKPKNDQSRLAHPRAPVSHDRPREYAEMPGLTLPHIAMLIQLEPNVVALRKREARGDGVCIDNGW